MDELVLFFRLALSTVFLSAGLSKVGKWEYHRIMVEEYRILPIKWVPLFIRVEVLAELLAGILLLFGASAGAWLVSGLLIAYTSAIGINLWRGRKTISCGCGGALGDHQLSGWLVMRNLIFLASSLVCIRFSSDFGSLEAVLRGGDVGALVHPYVFIISLASYAGILILLVSGDLTMLYRRIRTLFEE